MASSAIPIFFPSIEIGCSDALAARAAIRGFLTAPPAGDNYPAPVDRRRRRKAAAHG